MKTQKEHISWENREYFNYFFSCQEGSYKLNWIKTEKWFQKKYFKTKYTSYSSFRKAKSKYLYGLDQRRKRRENIKQ